MLQDLWMLSIYFDPPQACITEDELKKYYGEWVVRLAHAKGWLNARWICDPKAGHPQKMIWLSPCGADVAQLSHRTDPSRL